MKFSFLSVGRDAIKHLGTTKDSALEGQLAWTRRVVSFRQAGIEEPLESDSIVTFQILSSPFHWLFLRPNLRFLLCFGPWPLRAQDWSGSHSRPLMSRALRPFPLARAARQERAGRARGRWGRGLPPTAGGRSLQWSSLAPLGPRRAPGAATEGTRDAAGAGPKPASLPLSAPRASRRAGS